MSLRPIMEIVQFVTMWEQMHQQRLAWDDAAKARIARDLAERRAALQLRAMRGANPSGQLGNAQLNDPQNLKDSGLL